jgi:UbiD family decarboxylase
MVEHSFPDFLKKLDLSGQTLHLNGSVSGTKMAERALKECGDSGKGLIFLRNDIPIAMNLYASERRVLISMGGWMPKFDPEQTDYPKLTYLSPDPYTDISFADLPILKHHEDDVSGSINLGCTICETEGRHNCGVYRIQPLEDNEAIIHCYPESGLARELTKGSDVPVTIAIGTSPHLLLPAVSKLPEWVDELRLANHICDGDLKFIKTDRHPVPYGTQIIIQATVSATEKRSEGPFRIYTGELSEVADYPLMRIESVKLIMGGVYQTLVTGASDTESQYLLRAAEQFISGSKAE